MVPLPFAVALLFALLLLPTTSLGVPEQEPLCASSERLEILNEALEDAFPLLEDPPTIGCDVGPWRTFRREKWELSDRDWDFVENVAQRSQANAVPEPSRAGLALAALAALRLAGRTRARWATR